MSEFSESYHLRSNSSQDAVDLLRQIGRKGYVFPAVNGWVTFVAHECELATDLSIVGNAKTPLLHYLFGEDFGWCYDIFEGHYRTAMYSCSWHEDLDLQDEYYSRAKLLQIVPDADVDLLDEFESHLRPASADYAAESEAGKLFARAIKLEHFEWLAYEYVEITLRDAPDEYPDVIAVQ